MHFLVAPTDEPVHGFTREVIEPRDGAAVRRPGDAPRGGRARRRATTAVHALNAAVGFEPAGDRRAAGQAGAAELLHARAVRGGGADERRRAPRRPTAGPRPTARWSPRRWPSSRTSGCSTRARRPTAAGRSRATTAATTYRFAAERHRARPLGRRPGEHHPRARRRASCRSTRSSSCSTCARRSGSRASGSASTWRRSAQHAVGERLQARRCRR